MRDPRNNMKCWELMSDVHIRCNRGGDGVYFCLYLEIIDGEMNVTFILSMQSTSKDEEMHVVDHRKQVQQGGGGSHGLKREEVNDEYGLADDHGKSQQCWQLISDARS